MHLDAFSVDDRPALAPIGLALAPRRRFKPDRRLDFRFLPQRTDESFDRRVAALITTEPDFFEDRLGTVAHRRQPPENVFLKRAQELAFLLLSAIALRLFLTEDLPDRLNADPDGSGNGFLRFLESEPAVDFVPQIRFDHVVSSRLDGREEAYLLLIHLLTPFKQGGNFSMTAGG